MNKFYFGFLNRPDLLSKMDSGSHSPHSWLTRSCSKFSFTMLFLSLLLSTGFGFAQSISNYAFATGTNGSLEDISTGNTSYLSGVLDDTAGTVQALGFDFLFMGVKYTHFSANSNGQMRLHSSSTETATGANVSTAANTAILAPFTGDNEIGNGMRFKVLGTAPNRTFVLEWNQFYVFYSNISNAGNMQVWLDESSGKITYIYGEIYNSSTSSVTRSISLASSNTATTVGSITIGAVPTFTAGATPIVNTIAAGANPIGAPLVANIGSLANGSRRFFTFTPPTVVSGDVTTLSFTSVTGSTTTLNWIDNATNEFGFLVTRATDAAFTQNVTNVSVASTTSAGTGTAYISAQTGLFPGTTYFYKIVALVEAGQSTGINGNQITLPAGNVNAVASGNWSDVGTWSTGVVPTNTDNVIVPAGITVTQDVTAASALSLLVQGDLVYTVTTARTLTVISNVTIYAGASIKSAATGTVLTHSLLIGGSLINNGTLDFSTNAATAGATITFNSVGNANFTLGAGSITNLRNAAGVTLNKGTSRANVLTFNPGGTLTVQGANTLGFMVITNGLLILDGTNTFNNPLFATNGYTIAANGGYWQNNPNATVIGLGGSPTVIGLFRLSSGTFNIGTSTGNSMGFSANSIINIEGGTINAASRFGVASSANAINYSQSGGTINVNQVGNTSTTLASFDLGTNGTTSVVNFTGGTVNVVLASTATSGPRDVRGTGLFLPNFTGTGMINFGTAASGATPLTYFISGNVPALTISTASAIHNLSLNAAAQSFGTVTIPAASTLNLNGFRFILRGSSLVNNGVLAGTTTGSDLYFFGGINPQSYSGTGVCTEGLISLSVDTVANPFTIAVTSSGLNPLRVNLFSGTIINSNKITIGTGLALATALQVGAAASTNPGGNFDVSPTWNLGTGTNALIYAQESVPRTSGFEVNPTRTVNTLSIDNTNGLTISGGNITTNASLALTNGIVTTGTNTLQLGNATTIGTLTGGSATAYVNGSLTRAIADANVAFVPFPIGKAGAYTPIALQPATTSIALFKAESFDSNLGTANAAIIDLSANRRFEALPVSGTFTNINVRLSDAAITATNIPVQAPTAAGAYTSAFGSTATFAAGPPITVTSTTPVSSANYTGFLSFANSNVCMGAPTPGNTIASANALCLGQSVTLSLQNTTAGSGVTYQWKSSTDGITYVSIADATASTLSVTPAAATFYLADVTCAASSTTTASLPVQINFANTVVSTIPAARCGIGSVTLNATPSAGASIDWYANATGGVSLASGASFVSPSIEASTTYYAAASTATAGTAGIGLGALTSTNVGISFLSGGWGGVKTQYIIRASELIAAGIAPGAITSLGFEATSSGQTYTGFSVSIGATNLNAMTTTFIASNLSQVYLGTLPNDGFLPVANTLNTLAFGTGTGSASSFVWDGTSNIVLSISRSSVPGASTSIASGMKYDAAGFTSTAYDQADNLTPTAMLASATADATTSNRPMFIVNGQVLCSSARVAVLATVTTPPVFTLSDATKVICEGSSSNAVTITSNAADFDSYVWSPMTGVTGNAATGWVFNPTVSTTYSLTATQTAGGLCADTAVVIVTVNPLPTALTFDAQAVTSCTNTIVPLTVAGGTLANIAILNENFNGVTSSFTTVNNTTGAADNTIPAWTLRASGFVQGSTYISNDASQFYLSNSDAAGSGNNTNVSLISPSFSTLNFTEASLELNHAYQHWTSGNGTATIAYSIDNGGTWVDFQTYTANVGANNNFVDSVLPLPAGALNQATVKLRFTHMVVWGYFWAINSIKVSGTQTTAITWSPATNLFTDAEATTAYASGSSATVVYYKSSTAGVTDYTATATSGATCSLSAITTVTNVDCSIPYANVQFPGTSTIAGCQNETFYLQVYKAGITEVQGPGAGITMWIGISTTNDDPATWPATVWQPTTYNGQSDFGFGNNDEFQYTTNGLGTGTYYIASRSQYAATSTAIGPFFYGGFSSNGGGAWNGTSNVNAVLTVFTVAPPTASAAQTFCNAVTVADLTALGTTVKWYTEATGGTALVSTASLVTGNYYASQTLNTCESPTRTLVEVTVNVTPAPTVLNQSFCASATVADLSATETGIQWYAASTGGTALAGTTALASGNYYVSQTIAGCESARTMVAVTVNVTTAPTASTQTFCGSATVADLMATGTSIQWYAASTGGTALAGTTALVSGNYFVSQTIAGCESTRTMVVVTINVTDAPTASAQTFCGSATVGDLMASGTGLQWYSFGFGGSPLASTDTLASGDYYVSQTVAGCESQRTMVAVTVNVTSLPIASAQTFCVSATVANLIATGTGLQWYTTSTGGTALAGTSVLSSTNYYVSQTIAGCESARTMVAVTVNVISDPTASTQSYCQGATVAELVAAGNAGATFQWYAAATGGTALTGTTALASGTYYVSQTVAGCESARTMVVVTVDSLPVIISQPVGTTICVGESITFSVAATGTALTYQWFKDNVVIAGATSPSYSIMNASSLDAGNYTVSVSGSCSPPVTSTFAVVSVQNTAAPTGVATQDFTTGQTVADFTVVGQNIVWYSDATGSTVLPATTLLVSGTTYYASQTINGCESMTRLAVTAGTDLKSPTFEVRNLLYYPNPVVDVLTVSYSDAIQGVQLYNILGQMVYNRSTNTSQVTIDMAAMAAGTYLMQVTVKGITKNVKVMKK